jgi:hypothetical protein
MAPDKQVDFIEKWFTRAEQETDVIDRFIGCWIALTIAATTTSH